MSHHYQQTILTMEKCKPSPETNRRILSWKKLMSLWNWKALLRVLGGTHQLIRATFFSISPKHKRRNRLPAVINFPFHVFFNKTQEYTHTIETYQLHHFFLFAFSLVSNLFEMVEKNYECSMFLLSARRSKTTEKMTFIPVSPLHPLEQDFNLNLIFRLNVIYFIKLSQLFSNH